jgi:hypothetical protein
MISCSSFDYEHQSFKDFLGTEEVNYLNKAAMFEQIDDSPEKSAFLEQESLENELDFYLRFQSPYEKDVYFYHETLFESNSEKIYYLSLKDREERRDYLKLKGAKFPDDQLKVSFDPQVPFEQQRNYVQNEQIHPFFDDQVSQDGP